MAQDAGQRGQEFVIGGYTPSAKNFDAMVIGFYEGKKLHYSARVRNGFTPATREKLFKVLKPYETDKCPFANLPELKSGRVGCRVDGGENEGLPVAGAGPRGAV
jgi:ATP-dependent DNA ligase